jgi:glyoxylase-like metal-dependent hydrolase (beta-lactamase superfamily II)
MCLYEPNQKILVSGDHILFDITPNITSWPNMENTLDEYLKNLDKVYPLDVNLVLPGHRSIEKNHRQRILELKVHHRARADEILAALGQDTKTAYQIAPLVTWNVSYNSWEQFPTPQKFFATGEVIAHLKYLEGEGSLHSGLKDGQTFFCCPK